MDAQETSLGATLRAWRDRLSPAAAGLPARHGRRAPGLRREELAELAGVSVDYVVRLEQGRAVAPSAQITGALARALQLTHPERDHLHRLAGLLPPGAGMIDDHIPPGIHRVLDRLGDTPVSVYAADWRLIWWNRAWAALLGAPQGVLPQERNLVASRLPVPGTRGTAALWPVRADNPDESDLAVVADLRQASARYPNDPRLANLISRTTAGNPRFARLWAQAEVRGHREDRKTIIRPDVGEITVDCDVLTDSDTDLKIVIYTVVPGSDDESKLALALVAGQPDHATTPPDTTNGRTATSEPHNLHSRPS